jgi:hypothetical protein
MQDRRHETAAGKGSTPNDTAGAAASPGKTTQVQLRSAEGGPVASDASAHDKKKGLVEAALDGLHEALKKGAEKVGEAVSDKVKEAPDKAVEKLLERLEGAADDEISKNLRPNDKSCLNQASINDVEAAINTHRLIAAYHMVHDIDKAVLAELSELKSHESVAKKAIGFIHHVGDALKALNTYGDAIAKANAQYARLLKQAARCRPIARINPQLKPLHLPKFHTLPDTIHLPPDIDKPHPPIHIPIPNILLVG